MRERIEKLHLLYVELTGIDIRLTPDREQDWFLWCKAGFKEEDLRVLVAHIRKGIGSGNRNAGALKFRNLIGQVDYFEEDLGMARCELRIAKLKQGGPREQVLRESGRVDGRLAAAPEEPKKMGEVIESEAFKEFARLKEKL